MIIDELYLSSAYLNMNYVRVVHYVIESLLINLCLLGHLQFHKEACDYLEFSLNRDRNTFTA